MNNNGGRRFFDGFLLGIVIGAAAVYLFGTKSGKRLVKKFSEEGFSGFEELIENYNSNEDEFEAQPEEKENSMEKEPTIIAVKPKKRLFKRFRRVD